MDYFLSIPSDIAVIIILFLCSLVSAILVTIVRKFFPQQKLNENNEYAGITYSVVGLIYGVFLAFAIVIAWGKFSDAENSAVYEVTYLSELWRDASVFPEDKRSDLYGKLISYVGAVKDREWKTMALSGKEDSLAKKAYEEIWQFFYDLRPQSFVEKEFYSESISQLNEIGRFRRERLLFSNAKVHSVLWLFLIIGAIITISFSFFLGTKHKWTQVIITSLISSLICFSIYLVFSLQFPFTGDVSIKNTMYELLYTSFESRTTEVDSVADSILTE